MNLSNLKMVMSKQKNMFASLGVQKVPNVYNKRERVIAKWGLFGFLLSSKTFKYNLIK